MHFCLLTLVCLSRLWLKWSSSIVNFCTKFPNVQLTARNECYNERKAACNQVFSQFKKNFIHLSTTRRYSSESGWNKGTHHTHETKTKYSGQMQTTKQNDNSMECLKSTVILNANNNRFVFLLLSRSMHNCNCLVFFFLNKMCLCVYVFRFFLFLSFV